MPTIDSVIKDQVARVAAKEIKAATADLKKEVTQLRREVAKLAKGKGGAPAAKATKKPAKAAGRPKKAAGTFSAKKLRDHRKSLGISAKAYADLVGCSLLSIYKWEKGETTPRAAQQDAIAKVMAKH